MSATQWLFISFVTVMMAIIIVVAWRTWGARHAAGLFVVPAVWFTYVALLSAFGMLQQADRVPPGMLFILGPVVGYSVALSVVTRSAPGVKLAAGVPLSLLTGLQTFRVGVELFIHQLNLTGLVPKMLTFSGANVDIYVGLSAGC